MSRGARASANGGSFVRLARLGGAAALMALSSACSKDDAPKTLAIHQRFETAPPPNAPGVVPGAPSGASGQTGSGSPPTEGVTGTRQLVGLFTDASAVQAATDEAKVQMFGAAPNAPTPGGAAPAAPVPAKPIPPNPDDAILANARTSLGRCFASLRAGPGQGPPSLDAKVQVSVIETGSVVRAEVLSSDVDDPAVLDCMQRTANGLRFSDNDGGPLRTYTIDVLLVAH